MYRGWSIDCCRMSSHYWQRSSSCGWELLDSSFFAFLWLSTCCNVAFLCNVVSWDPQLNSASQWGAPSEDGLTTFRALPSHREDRNNIPSLHPSGMPESPLERTARLLVTNLNDSDKVPDVL